MLGFYSARQDYVTLSVAAASHPELRVITSAHETVHRDLTSMTICGAFERLIAAAVHEWAPRRPELAQVFEATLHAMINASFATHEGTACYVSHCTASVANREFNDRAVISQLPPEYIHSLTPLINVLRHVDGSDTGWIIEARVALTIAKAALNESYMYILERGYESVDALTQSLEALAPDRLFGTFLERFGASPESRVILDESPGLLGHDNRAELMEWLKEQSTAMYGSSALGVTAGVEGEQVFIAKFRPLEDAVYRLCTGHPMPLTLDIANLVNGYIARGNLDIDLRQSGRKIFYFTRPRTDLVEMPVWEGIDTTSAVASFWERCYQLETMQFDEMMTWCRSGFSRLKPGERPILHLLADVTLQRRCRPLVVEDTRWPLPCLVSAQLRAAPPAFKAEVGIFPDIAAVDRPISQARLIALEAESRLRPITKRLRAFDGSLIWHFDRRLSERYLTQPHMSLVTGIKMFHLDPGNSRDWWSVAEMHRARRLPLTLLQPGSSDEVAPVLASASTPEQVRAGNLSDWKDPTSHVRWQLLSRHGTAAAAVERLRSLTQYQDIYYMAMDYDAYGFLAAMFFCSAVFGLDSAGFGA